MIAVIGSFALIEYRALLRARYPFVWFLVLPAAASAILGPAVAGLDQAGATGRVTVGFGVMFSYMTVNYVGHAMYREFESQAWRRTAISDPSRVAYLTGKCLPVYLVGIGQLTVFLAIAAGGLGLPLAAGTLTGVLQLAVTLVPFAATGVGVGMIMFTLIRRAEVFFSLTYLVLVVLGALGGAIVPSPQLPGWSQLVGHLTPHYWALRAIDEATLGAGSWTTVWTSSALLLVLGAGLIVAAAARLDLRKERYAI